MDPFYLKLLPYKLEALTSANSKILIEYLLFDVRNNETKINFPITS